MTRDAVVRILRSHEQEFRALGITRLALFGSFARNEATSESDLDVVVDVALDQRFSLIDLATVRLLVHDVTGADPDVVVRADLQPAFRQRLAADEVRVF